MLSFKLPHDIQGKAETVDDLVFPCMLDVENPYFSLLPKLPRITLEGEYFWRNCLALYLRLSCVPITEATAFLGISHTRYYDVTGKVQRRLFKKLPTDNIHFISIEYYIQNGAYPHGCMLRELMEEEAWIARVNTAKEIFKLRFTEDALFFCRPKKDNRCILHISNGLKLGRRYLEKNGLLDAVYP